MSTTHTTRILALAAAVAATPAVAQAHTRPRHHTPAARAYVMPIRGLSRRTVRKMRQQIPAVIPTPQTPFMTGAGGGIPNGCTSPTVPVVRVIVYWFEPISAPFACGQNATTSGAKLIVSIQYGGSWPLQQTIARFQQALALYGPLHPYAISIGNEQELDQQGSQIPAAYAATWRAVEPIVAHADPSALRVAGEISPWGLSWLMQAVHSGGLPGAQVYAAHVYPYDSPWASSPAPFVRLAAAHHVQAWATEGMCGMGAWMRYGCLSRSAIGAAGFSLGVTWLAGSPTAGSAPNAPTDTTMS